MMFGAFFVWAALIGLAVWGASRLFPSLGHSGLSRRGEVADGTPLEILARRYARGELSREEYDTIRDDLMASTGGDER